MILEAEKVKNEAAQKKLRQDNEAYRKQMDEKLKKLDKENKDKVDAHIKQVEEVAKKVEAEKKSAAEIADSASDDFVKAKMLNSKAKKLDHKRKKDEE